MDPKNILIVEDEEVIRSLCKRIFSQTGHNLILVGTVNEAYERIKNDSLDLLITDLRLPDGHGADVINKYKKRFPDQNTVIITGSPTPEKGLESMEDLGAIEWIYKPFERELLEAAVQSALNKNEKKGNRK